jgi:hypothetical protein
LQRWTRSGHARRRHLAPPPLRAVLSGESAHMTLRPLRSPFRVARQKNWHAETRSRGASSRFSGIMALLSCESVDIFSGAPLAPHNRDPGRCPGHRAAQWHLRGSAPPRAQTSEPPEKSKSRNERRAASPCLKQPFAKGRKIPRTALLRASGGGGSRRARAARRRGRTPANFVHALAPSTAYVTVLEISKLSPCPVRALPGKMRTVFCPGPRASAV